MKQKRTRTGIAVLTLIVLGVGTAIGYASIRSALSSGVSVVTVEESAYPIPGVESELKMIVAATVVQQPSQDYALLIELRPDPQFKEENSWDQINRATGRFIVNSDTNHAYSIALTFEASDDLTYDGRWALIQNADLQPGDPSMEELLTQSLCRVEIDDPVLGKTVVTKHAPTITLANGG